MAKRVISAALMLLMILALAPMSFADIEYVGIDKVNLESYPDSSSGNNLPIVGQNYSDFYCSTITPGVTVTGWSLVDDSGVTCSGIVENKSYTMNIYVSSQITNYFFTSNTKTYINGQTATATISADGKSATISRYISPVVVDPVIYKHPADENHDKSKAFSFTASASKYATSYQWYIMTTYGDKMTPEEFTAAYGVTATVADLGNNVTRLNISNPLDDMSGWLVYCTFMGYSKAPVATNKATMTIKGAVVTTPEPAITIVDAPDEVEATATPTPNVVDGVEVPDGITIVDNPYENVTVTTTPAPTTAPTPTVEVVEASDEKATSSTALKVAKYAGIVIGAGLVIGGVSLVMQYMKEKNKRLYRSKMAGKKNSSSYKGKH